MMITYLVEYKFSKLIDPRSLLGRRENTLSNLILEMRNIIKEFSGVRALNGVNLNVSKGHIHAIVGENGAGKSTLMNVLSGIYPHGTYEGSIIFDGQECRFKNINDSEKLGIVIIHQELALIPYLSIAENIFLNNEIANSSIINWDETYKRAKELMNEVGIGNENPTTLIKDIGIGKQQLVEIAKAMTKDVKLLILDEPTAALNEEDSANLLNILIRLKERGIVSILISHKLNEVVSVSDEITVIRDGASIETMSKAVDDINQNRIIKAMVGRELTDIFPKRDIKPTNDVTFEVKDWNVNHPVMDTKRIIRDVSIKVHKGEIVGISGLMGAGRTEFAMNVFGGSYGKYVSGQMFKNGVEIKAKNVAAAMEHGLAYVTEDRKAAGLILTDSIKRNISITGLKKLSKMSVINEYEEMKIGEEYREKLHTKCSSIEQHVGSLSGGNQQKVALSKWMFSNPDIFILDEPTRGIDVGAKYEIYTVINKLVEEGLSVIIISSELPEVLGMSDRIYVMDNGQIVGEFKREEASQEKIMASIMDNRKKGEVSHA